MSMDSVDEPSKWVCRLISSFGNGSTIWGSGFLVNVPYSKKFCIMTAGHNIITMHAGYTTGIKVIFPNGLIFNANPEECFVSKVYRDHPTTLSSEDSSISDYGLIAVSKGPHSLPDSKLDLGGCAFSVLHSEYDLLHMDVSVHGYKGEDSQQTRNASPLSRIDSHALYYVKETEEGVSGGPIFVSADGTNTAVAIHNYGSRATRLTCKVMLEMLGWIQDYSLRRNFEIYTKVPKDPRSPRIYLQATRGSSPNIVARPGLESCAYLTCIMTDAPKSPPKPGKKLAPPHYVMLPPQDRASQEKPLLLLTLDENEKESLVTFRETTFPQKKNIITIKEQGHKIILWFPELKYGLKVQHSNRGNHCNFGCITQDQTIGFDKTGTLLIISNAMPSDHTAENVHNRHTYTGAHEAEGRTPLYSAVFHRNPELASRLLQQNADPNASCRCGTSALSKAAENGDIKILDMLVRKGARTETKNLDGETPEDIAKRNGHIDVINRFEYHKTQRVELLLKAAHDGSVAEMPKLVESGVTPTARDLVGNSAMELAVQNGQKDAVLFLLRDMNVSANEADEDGVTALHWAAQFGKDEVVALLIEYGANPNVLNKKKMAPLHKAAIKGHLGAAKALRNGRGKANLDARGPTDMTPLMFAAQHGRGAMVKLLISLGADPTLEDKKGDTARDKAEKNGHDDIAKDLP